MQIKAATDETWAQAKLPISMGGLGLRAAKDHAAAAFSISYLSSQPLVYALLKQEVPDQVLLPASVLHVVTSKVGAEEPITSEFFHNVTQKMLSAKIDLNNQQLLLEQLKRVCWDFVGTLLGLLLDFFGTLLGHLWDFFWDFVGTSLGLFWDFFETSLGLLWDFFETSLGLLWDFVGTSVGLLWDFFGTSLEPYLPYLL